MRNRRQDIRILCVIKKSHCSGNSGLNLVSIPDATITFIIIFFNREQRFLFEIFNYRLLVHVYYVYAAARNICRNKQVL